MDLSSVSYAELEAELKRRNSISKSSSNNDDVMSPLLEITKVSPKAVSEVRQETKEEELKRLQDELEFQKLKNDVLTHQLRIEADIAEMQKEAQANRAIQREFDEECDRRIRATSTTEQLSLFPWFRH